MEYTYIDLSDEYYDSTIRIPVTKTTPGRTNGFLLESAEGILEFGPQTSTAKDYAFANGTYLGNNSRFSGKIITLRFYIGFNESYTNGSKTMLSSNINQLREILQSNKQEISTDFGGGTYTCRQDGGITSERFSDSVYLWELTFICESAF